MLSRILARTMGAVGLVLTLSALVVKPAHAQVDIIVGTITDQAGKPVQGAIVEALSIESDVTRRATTNAKGGFIIQFADGGGQYRITVRAIGHTPYIQNVMRQTDDDRIMFDVKLGEQAMRVQDLVATGNRRPDVNAADRPTTAESSRSISGQQALTLPIDASDLAMLAAMAPGVIFTAGTDSTASTFSVAGQSAASNSYVVNGVTTDASTIPADAVRNTRVITNTYDVSRGGFSGGQVSVTTKGGSNRVQGTLSSNIMEKGLAFGEATSNPFTAGTTQQRWSGAFGGPLKRDKTWLFGALQVTHNLNPIQSLDAATATTIGRLGASPDSINKFIQLVDATGLSGLVSGVDPNGVTTSYSSSLRFDWNMGQTHVVTITNTLGLTTRDPTSIGSTSLPQVGGDNSGKNGGLTLAVLSRMGAFTNNFHSGATVSDNKATPFLSVPVGRVTNYSQLDSGQVAVTTLGFGGNAGLPNHSNTKNYEVTDEVSWLPGTATHRFALGFTANHSDFSQDNTSNRYGTFTYNSLADFANNIPSAFTRTLQPNIRDGGIWNEGLYISDAWRPRTTRPAGAGGAAGGAAAGGGRGAGGGGAGGGRGGRGGGPGGGASNFQLTYGVRLEHTSYTGAPALNQAVLDEFGVRTDKLPSEVAVTPRIGFSWSIPSPEQQGQSQRGFAAPLVVIRGGAGVFRGTMPATLAGTAQSSSGLATANTLLQCVGAATPIPNWSDFASDPSTIPTECIDNNSTPVILGVPSITTYDPNYGASETRRASLGLQRRITTRINFTADASYVKGVGQAASKDLNLNETARFHLADGRPVFADPNQIVTTTGQIPLSASRIDPNFGSVRTVFSSLENETKQLTLNVSGNTSKQIQLSLAYTLMWARDMGGAGGGFGGGGGNLTAGDPNLYEWARSSNEHRHNIQMNISWPITPAWELTALGSLQSGSPYTPIVSGDINGDGSRGNDRAFIYNPANVTDSALKAGMTNLLASSTGSALACLQSQLGTIAARNTCEGPWRQSLNFQLNWRPNFFERRLSLSFATSNFLPGLDELIHGANNLKGWGQNINPDATLLTVKSFDPTTNTFNYSVNSRFGTTSAAALARRVPFQLQLIGRYAIGYDPRTLQIQGLGRGGAGGPANMNNLMDSILTKYRGQNAASAALARKDSIALLPAQVIKLQALLDSSNATTQPQIDSMVQEMTKVQKAGSAADLNGLMQRMGPFTRVLLAEQARVHDGVQKILDDVQWALLPDAVRNPQQNLMGNGGRGRGGPGGPGGPGGGPGGGRGGGF